MKNEKKYVIHILSVSVIDGETFDLPQEQNAIIVCTNTDNEYINQCLKENILILDFPDVASASYPGAFDKGHARRIVDFVENLSDQVTDIYVCCAQGVSRSPAVVAALLRASGRSDDAVWCNPYYSPNSLVYKILCTEYGLPISESLINSKILQNQDAFKMAKKCHQCKYERWQLIY